MPEFKYKAFISYSHADDAFAGWLLKSLESYRVPKNLVGTKTVHGIIPERLSPIFRDREELPASGAMTERLIDALQHSAFLIVVCSPHAAKSKLVNREIIEFKRIHGDGRILCMIVDGAPFSDDPEIECFPEALLHSFHTDGVKAGLSAEGLAADLRPQADGKSMGLMKIIAGMLGVGLNDIVQRQERRRQNQLAIAATVAGLGLSAMGYLTFEAISARKDAENAQYLAEAKRQEALERLIENEELTHFMMTNVYEELLTVGSLDTLENITNHVLAYYERRDIDSLSEKQIFSLTGAQLRLGQMLDRRGDSVRAEKIFEKTLKISREFHARAPNSNFALFRLSNTLFFTGYLADRQGRLERALQDYHERLELVKSATHMMPPFVRSDWKPHWQNTPVTFWHEKTADSENIIARLLAGPLRGPEAALEYARSSVFTRENLAELSDGYKESYISLASSYQTLGNAYLRAGQLEEALNIYIKRLAIFERLAAEEPSNYRILRRLLLSQANIARISLLRGNTADARQTYEEITQGFDILTRKDPKNTLWLADSAESYLNLARTAFDMNDRPMGETAARRGETQIAEALMRDNTRPARRLIQYQFSLLEAQRLEQAGQKELATEQAQNLLSRLEKEDETFTNVSGSQNHHAAVLLLQGDLMASAQMHDEARRYWHAIIERANALPGTASLPAKHKLGLAYHRLGQHDKEREIHEAIGQFGYQNGIVAH